MYHCNNMQYLDTGKSVLKLITDICDDCGFNIVGNPVVFDRINVMAIVLLAESHISVHTNRTHAYIDIFCCSGEDAAEKAYDLFMARLEPKSSTRNSLRR